MGMELDVLQLLSAWTWSEDFDLQSKFSDLADELRPFGFHGLGDDSNLLLRCCAAIVAGDVSPGALVSLNGATVRDRFPEIVNGVKGAIDFLKQNVHVEALSNLPYTALLVPLAAFFAVPHGKGLKVTAAQRRFLLSWFWKACFSRRYSAGVIRNLNRDIEEAVKLRTGVKTDLASFNAGVEPEFFTSQTFTLGTVHTNVFILMLADLDPLTFVSGSPIGLGQVLQAYNRNEFHHVYPRAYLKDQGRDTSEINRIVNFVFMSSTDNKTLGGVAPSQYRDKMDEKLVPKILEHSACPASIFDDDFDAFANDRAGVLATHARRLMTQ
jgi:hypothetical protein